MSSNSSPSLASVVIARTLLILALMSTYLLSALLSPTVKNTEPVVKARRKQAVKTAVRAKILFATTRPLLAAVDWVWNGFPALRSPGTSPGSPSPAASRGNDELLTGSCDFAQDDELFWGNDEFLFSVCVCVCVCVCVY